MREIKFRAWDKENNYMFQVHALSLPINLMVHTELMQFTGLKDKNSVEIYEGDILSFREYQDEIIIFNHGAFGYGDRHFVSLHQTNLSIAEVIGNIYGHSYLLDNKEQK